LAEVCSGTSGNCPPDIYKEDTTSCSNGMQCASGQCTSRDQQCVARGATYQMTKSCSGDSSGCQVSCQDPRSALSCIVFPGSFIDGTPCGIGGVCKSGSCNNSNFGNNALNWINNNKQIVIPVAIVVGLLLLFCLFRCCCYGGNGYDNIGKTTTYVIPAQSQQYPGQYNNAQPPYYPPPPPLQNGQQQQYYTPPPQGWVDPAQYNGSGFGGSHPQPPLPVYSQNDPHADAYELNNANNWQRNNGASSPAIPHSPAPGYQQQMPSPSPANNNNPYTTPTPPPHGGQRPYHEGVI
jgi:hypothetical protein